MRLRQLARKLGVHPEKILTLLSESGHELQNDANSKLTEEQVEITLTHFPLPVVEAEATEEDDTSTTVEAPQEIEEPASALVEVVNSEEPVESTEAKDEVTGDDEEVTEEVIEKSDPDLEHLEIPFGPPSHATSQVSEIDREQPIEAIEKPEKVIIQLEKQKPEVKVYNAIEEDEEFLNAELIKTEKPVLEGLKVVGKIELPEPKKPTEKTEEDTDAEEKSDKSSQKNDRRKGGRNDRGKGRNGRNQRQRLSPLEYERQKAERLAKKKKKEAERKLKKKKEEHYRAKLDAKLKAKKKTPPAKPKKQVVEEEEAMAPLPINGMSRPKPVAPKAKKKKGKGPLKKFWGWLNGESDKF
ncbi:MAG: hypothetical protein HEP71_04060 [Roseivirga sp.]|nr:hypothetical protein [Roseivirga sp.]